MQRLSNLYVLKTAIRSILKAAFFPAVFLVFLSSCVVLRSNESNKVENSNKSLSRKLTLVSPLSTPFTMTQKFKSSSGKKHKGVDLASKKGTPIFSAEDGRVIYAGRKFSGYGKMIMIDHGQGIATLYSHLDSYKVTSGQNILKKQLVGTMGRTGRATGVHLHFEVMENKIPVDPEKYIKF